MRNAKVRLWAESVLAAIALGLGVLTIFWREWIEAIFGVEPDNGSGATEWGIVVALLCASALLGLLARRDRRRLRAVAKETSSGRSRI